MEIAALVLGIIGFILAWIPGCGIVLGSIPALVGLVLAIIALVKKMPKKKQAIAGLVLSVLAFIAMIVSILVIPLIATGVYTHNSTVSAIQKSEDISSKSIAMYNDIFETYKGTNVSGSEAKALCNAVVSHNASYSSDLTKQIEVVNGTASNKSASSFKSSQTSSAQMVSRLIKTTSKYTITLGYDPDTGYITQIGIKQNGSSDNNKL